MLVCPAGSSLSVLTDGCVFPRQLEHQILSYGQTECGKGKCPYDPSQKTASAVVGEWAPMYELSAVTGTSTTSFSLVCGINSLEQSDTFMRKMMQQKKCCCFHFF